MNAISNALIDYWHRLPATPASTRCRNLERTCQHVRDGDLAPDALVPYALADSDEDVVYAAVSHYLDSARSHDPGRGPATDDALEWIRRHLALNRGAVFAAVLGRGDPALNERLSSLRLTLSADDVATVARRAARRPCTHSRRFLHDWFELLSGEGARPEREHLAAALGAGAVARAA
ncbi:MAG: hypothetical protein WBO04_05295 [Steroidobacteraceae bacterium]